MDLREINKNYLEIDTQKKSNNKQLEDIWKKKYIIIRLNLMKDLLD